MGSRRRRKRKKRAILFSIVGIAISLVVATGVYMGSTTQPSKALTNHVVDDSFLPTGNSNIYEKIKNQQFVRYLIIGDSIGAGDGASTEFKWYNQLSKKLESENGVIAFPYRITTSGSTVFNGWYDFNNQPIYKEMDLVFICFGQNDQSQMTEEQYGAVYENLIHSVKATYKGADVYTITESSLQNDKMSNIIEKLSKYYGLTNIDTRTAFAKSNQPYKSLTDDGTHPNKDGYTLYADYIYNTIMSKMPTGKVTVDLDKDLLFSQSSRFDTAGIITPAFEGLKEGEVQQKVSFKGNYIGISINKNELGGKFKVYVDGNLAAELTSYNKFPITHKVLIADNLKDGDHTLEIRLSDKSAKVDIKGYIT